MDLEDFKLYFSKVTILRYRDNWKQAYLEFNIYPGKTQAVALKIPETTTVAVSLNWDKKYQNKDGTYDTSRFTLLQLTPILRVIVHCSPENDRDVSAEEKLEAGEYLIIPEIATDADKSITVVAYSEKDVVLSLDR
jgi:hypothetical protein